jgi:hypothetical protein
MPTYVRSTTWRPGWTTYAFPVPPGTNTPQFITRWAQLPVNVTPGSVVIVSGGEEFSNPSDHRSSGDSYTINGQRSEHWTTPIFGSGELVKAPAGTTALADYTKWTPICPGMGENWNNVTHHWMWSDTTMFVADASTAGSYVGLRFWFGRSTGYRDPVNDYIKAEKTYGRVEAAVID